MKRIGLITILAAGLLSLGAGPAAAKPKLPCNDGGGAAVAKVKPKACTVLPSGASFSEGTNLAKLKWSSFGRSRANFRGIEKGFHLPASHIRVRGYAYRPRTDRCGSPTLIFTRVFVKSRFGSMRVKTDTCVR